MGQKVPVLVLKLSIREFLYPNYYSIFFFTISLLFKTLLIHSLKLKLAYFPPGSLPTGIW